MCIAYIFFCLYFKLTFPFCHIYLYSDLCIVCGLYANTYADEEQHSKCLSTSSVLELSGTTCLLISYLYS